MPDIDPRFDPRFQRGYDAAGSDSRPPRRAGTESGGAVREERTSRDDPATSAFRRPGDGAPEPAPIEPAPRRPAEGREGRPRHEEARDRGAARPEPAVSRIPSRPPELDDDLEAPRNPFRVALLVAAIAFLVLAVMFVAWYVLSVDSFFQPRQEFWPVLLLLLREQLPAPLLFSSGISFVAWLLLGALSPRRRRSDGE